MNFEYFIANRLRTGKKPGQGSAIIGTRPILRIAIVSVILGIAVMIVSFTVLSGFKKEIRDKVTGFGSDIQITAFDANVSFEPKPIGRDQPFYPFLDTVNGVRHIQVFATKAGIIKAKEDIEGVILKGIGSDFDWDFFKKNIVEGDIFHVADTIVNNSVLISRITAKRLLLKTGDEVVMYFIQTPPRARKFTISGIYETGLEEFDKLYVFGDIGHVQKLNDWTPSQVGGFEVLADEFDDLPHISNAVYNAISYDLNAQTIKELYPQIFAWLELQDMNVIIIITLMLLVSGINMISALLILILEQTRMIGVLKALGAHSHSIRKIFLYKGSFLIGAGLLFGNILGLSLSFIQKYFGIIRLDQASYYVSVVPIHFDVTALILLNAGTFAVCMVMLVLPTYLITTMSPVKAIRFS